MNIQKSPSDSEATFQHDTKEHYAAAGIIFQKKFKVESQIPTGQFKKTAPRNFANTLLLVLWTNVNVFYFRPGGLAVSMEKDYKPWAFSA